MRILSTALLLFALAGCQSTSKPAPPARTASLASPAVVTVLLWKPGKGRDQGTGFFTAHNRVVTNEHVMLGATRARVRFANGREVDVDAVLASDPDADLALLAVEPGCAVRPLRLATSPPPVGSNVTTIGSPGGDAQTVQHGRVLSHVITTRYLEDAIHLSLPSEAGASGSPILNDRREVVGVLAQKWQGRGGALAIPSERVSRLTEGAPRSVADWSNQALNEARLAGRLLMPSAYHDTHLPDRPEDALLSLQESRDVLGSQHLRAVASYWIGASLANLGRPEESENAYRLALRWEPRFVEAHEMLGRTLEGLGRYDEAIAAFDAARRLSPGSRVGRDTRGSRLARRTGGAILRPASRPGRLK